MSNAKGVEVDYIPYRSLTGTLPGPYRFTTCIPYNVYADPY